MANNSSEQFDPFERESQLRAESSAWDTSDVKEAVPGDIPVVDLADYFTNGSKSALVGVADQLRSACENVGFYSIVGHQVAPQLIQSMFEMAKRFHQLPLSLKTSMAMDQPNWPLGGVGYLPLKNRKLPSRVKGNLNEAFIVKRDHKIGMEQNQWPLESSLPGFRKVVSQYADALEALGKQLLPIYATALDMPQDFFNDAFVAPQYRLRMTHYPPIAREHSDEYGIAPHVDTTFCTILAQDQPGLCIFSEPRQQWIKGPALTGTFIVNSGELLKQWSNDRFISVKHFANNNAGEVSRYSIPFFLNANSHYKMTCIPSCTGPDNPEKYPAISYAESQAVAQGE